MRYIELTQGERAIVDDEDFIELSQQKWRCSISGDRQYKYAVRSVPDWDQGRKIHRTIYMSVWLLRPPDGMVVDYINGNTLDNRRSNLRLATRQQDTRNKCRKKPGYKGVFKDKDKWRAFIEPGNGKRIYLGTFTSPENAARAYNEAAVKYFGEFAHTNNVL